MNFTTEQLLLVAGIVLIIYALVGALGISVRQVQLPALPPLTRLALCFFGAVLIFLGIANQILHTEKLSNPRLSIQNAWISASSVAETLAGMKPRPLGVALRATSSLPFGPSIAQWVTQKFSVTVAIAAPMIAPRFGPLLVCVEVPRCRNQESRIESTLRL